MAGPLRSELIPRAASPCLGPSPKWGGGRRQGRSGPRLQRPPGDKAWGDWSTRLQCGARAPRGRAAEEAGGRGGWVWGPEPDRPERFAQPLSAAWVQRFPGALRFSGE